MRFITGLLVASAFFLSCQVGGADESLKLVPVASYINRDEVVKTVGARVFALLKAKNIKTVCAGSFAMTVDVPDNRAAEARQLLAAAIKAEKLQLSILVPKGDRYVVVTPESILEPKLDK
jgi:hypothetical protein